MNIALLTAERNLCSTKKIYFGISQESRMSQDEAQAAKGKKSDNKPGETTINVKHVSAKAWQRAKEAAGRNGEDLGPWVSRACNLLADMEVGGREFVPGQPVNPMSHDQLTARISAAAELLKGFAAVQAAAGHGVGRSTVSKVMTTLKQLQVDNEPVKPTKPKALPPVVRTIGVD